uniref:ubiquitinyl hydrolase 1 n=1 Tax=Hirondellea gigas TaxID=1518452 RepID=A0A6A7GCS2_9CRUS
MGREVENEADSDKYHEEKRNDHDVGQMFINKWLDIKDTVNNWCEAQVIDLTETKILVHYKGWKSKFDEWIKIADVERIAVLNSYTDRPRKYGTLSMKVGERCDVLDSQDKWCIASIIDVNTVREQCKVHYPGWSDRYDEWIDSDSYRMAPLYRFTPEPENERLQRQNRCRPQSTFTATSSHEENFRNLLKAKHGWEIAEMENDGNCLFRSISHQVYGNPEFHTLVREKCVEYMESESSFFRNYIIGDNQDYEDYCKNMRRDGIWGDNVEIQCMSEIYDRPVEVFAYQAEPMKTYRRPSQQGSKPPIRLSYHFQSHYNSVIHPRNHHFVISNEQPGEIEDRCLKWSALRSRQALDQAISLSDVEATELEGMRIALTHSRGEFEGQQSIDFDKAVHESVLVFEQTRKEKLQKDIAKAKEISLDDSSDLELKKALQQSLEDTFTLTSDVLSVPDVESEVLQRVIKETRSDTSESWPEPVRHCHKNLGFSLELCVEAFSIFGTQSNVSDDIVISNMTNYMLESSNRLKIPVIPVDEQESS